MGRPSNRKARREQIVFALGRLIPTQGFRGTSIKDIAKEAKLGSGLVHYHFDSKQEIFLSLIEHLNDVIKHRYDARISPSDAPIEQLRAFIDAHLALGDDADPAALACWVAIGAESLGDPDVASAYQNAITERTAQLRRVVASVCKEREIASRHLESFVATITALIEGYFHIATTVPGLVPSGSAADAVFVAADSLLQPR